MRLCRTACMALVILLLVPTIFGATMERADRFDYDKPLVELIKPSNRISVKPLDSERVNINKSAIDTGHGNVVEYKDFYGTGRHLGYEDTGTSVKETITINERPLERSLEFKFIVQHEGTSRKDFVGDYIIEKDGEIQFIIKKPFVIDDSGEVFPVDYNYENQVFTMELSNMASMKFPIVIDPTIVYDDFTKSNYETERWNCTLSGDGLCKYKTGYYEFSVGNYSTGSSSADAQLFAKALDMSNILSLTLNMTGDVYIGDTAGAGTVDHNLTIGISEKDKSDYKDLYVYTNRTNAGGSVATLHELINTSITIDRVNRDRYTITSAEGLVSGTVETEDIDILDSMLRFYIQGGGTAGVNPAYTLVNITRVEYEPARIGTTESQYVAMTHFWRFDKLYSDGFNKTVAQDEVTMGADFICYGSNSTMSFDDNDLIHWYMFDDNANDAGSLGDDMTPTGTPQYVEGGIGDKYAELNGTTQYFTSGGATTTYPDISLSFWINNIGEEQSVTIVGKGTTATDDNYFCSVEDGELVVCCIGTGSGQTCVSSDYTTEEWTHYAMTYRESDKNLSMYLNGLKTNDTISGTDKAEDNSNSIIIGNNGTDYLKASVDDVRIYNTTLTTLELQSLYRTTRLPMVVTYESDNGLKFGDSTTNASYCVSESNQVGNFEDNKDYSIEMYINFTKQSKSTGKILAKTGGSNPQLLVYRVFNTVRFTLNDTAGFSKTLDTPSLTVGTMNHIVLSVTRNNNASLYLNGVLVDSEQVDNVDNSNSQSLYLGRDTGSSTFGDYWNGSMMYLKFYGRALQPWEVQIKNTSLEDYTPSVLNLTFKNSQNGDLITETVDFQVYKSGYLNTNSTTSGNFSIAPIEPGTYTIEANSSDFQPQKFNLDIDPEEFENFVIYLTNQSISSVEDNVFTITDDVGIPQSSALVSVYRVVDGVSSLIGQQFSDTNGKTSFTLDTDFQYSVIVTKEGYNTITATYNPTSPYTRTYILEDIDVQAPQDIQSYVQVRIRPNIGQNLEKSDATTFNFTVTPLRGDMTSFFIIFNSTLSNTSFNDAGGTISLTINTSDYINSTINFTYRYRHDDFVGSTYDINSSHYIMEQRNLTFLSWKNSDWFEDMTLVQRVLFGVMIQIVAMLLFIRYLPGFMLAIIGVMIGFVLVRAGFIPLMIMIMEAVVIFVGFLFADRFGFVE